MNLPEDETTVIYLENVFSLQLDSNFQFRNFMLIF
jgi:hypothetical protein